MELVRSFGLQAHNALSLADNLIWSEEGSPYFSPDYLHARTAFYTQQSIVAGLVPTIEYQRWWTWDLKERLHRCLDASINKFAKNRSGPWRNLASDAPPEMCVALSFKVMSFDLSDNKSDDRFEFEVRSDGIRLTNTFQDISINMKLWILEISITSLWLVVAESRGTRRLETMLLQDCFKAEVTLGTR